MHWIISILIILFGAYGIRWAGIDSTTAAVYAGSALISLTILHKK